MLVDAVIEVADAPALNAALNVVQLAVLVALLRWVRHGCEQMLADPRRDTTAREPGEPPRSDVDEREQLRASRPDPRRRHDR